MQASQIGTMNAFTSIQQAGFDEGIDSQDPPRGTKYFAMMQATDAYGMPQVTWASVPEVVVGRYSVRAVIDRMCNKLIITDALQDCLVREIPLPVTKANAGSDPVEDPNARQFRVTVRVTDAKGTQTFTQAMVSRF
jgi:hypothetical protein